MLPVHVFAYTRRSQAGRSTLGRLLSKLKSCPLSSAWEFTFLAENSLSRLYKHEGTVQGRSKTE